MCVPGFMELSHLFEVKCSSEMVEPEARFQLLRQQPSILSKCVSFLAPQVTRNAWLYDRHPRSNSHLKIPVNFYSFLLKRSYTRRQNWQQNYQIRNQLKAIILKENAQNVCVILKKVIILFLT